MIHRLKDYGNAITLLVIFATAVASAATAQYQIRNQGERLNAIETRQRMDHDTMTEIRVDVSWIRKALEKQDG
tara:strand:- start:185 stop:403 length:219 start_codon:yes stop_codon:yes gene_type:complete